MRQVRRYCFDDIVLLRGPTGTEGVGTDVYGEPLESATPDELALKARVEWDNQLIMDDTGREVRSVARIFIPPTYPDPATGEDVELTIGPEDRIVFRGRAHFIARRNLVRGWETDPGRHWEIYIS